MTKECPYCEGSGIDPFYTHERDSSDCPLCKGTGEVEAMAQQPQKKSWWKFWSRNNE